MASKQGSPNWKILQQFYLETVILLIKMVAGQGAVLSVIHTLQRSNKHDVKCSAPTF